MLFNFLKKKEVDIDLEPEDVVDLNGKKLHPDEETSSMRTRKEEINYDWAQVAPILFMFLTVDHGYRFWQMS